MFFVINIRSYFHARTLLIYISMSAYVELGI